MTTEDSGVSSLGAFLCGEHRPPRRPLCSHSLHNNGETPVRVFAAVYMGSRDELGRVWTQSEPTQAIQPRQTMANVRAV